MAQMREAKIRFGERAWQLIQDEATEDGVSASQFVREAALERAVFERARREDGDLFAGIARIVRDLSEEDGEE